MLLRSVQDRESERTLCCAQAGVTIEEERTTLDGVKDNQRARSSIAGIPGRRRRGAPGQVRGERLSSRITSPEGFVGLDAIVARPIPGSSMTRPFAPLSLVTRNPHALRLYSANRPRVIGRIGRHVVRRLSSVPTLREPRSQSARIVGRFTQRSATWHAFSR